MTDACAHYCTACHEAPCGLIACLAAENARLTAELAGMQRSLDGFREDLRMALRWNAVNRLGPLASDDPLVRSPAEPCRVCKQPFQPGEHVAVVTVGRGDNPATPERVSEGRRRTPVALPVHWTCATDG